MQWIKRLCTGALEQSLLWPAIRHQSAHPNESAIRNPQSAMTWRSLFDGKSLDAWRGYKNAAVPAGWKSSTVR